MSSMTKQTTKLKVDDDETYDVVLQKLREISATWTVVEASPKTTIQVPQLELQQSGISETEQAMDLWTWIVMVT